MTREDATNFVSRYGDIRSFLFRHCYPGGGYVEAEGLYADYIRYCEGRGRRPVARATFDRDVERAFPGCRLTAGVFPWLTRYRTPGV